MQVEARLARCRAQDCRLDADGGCTWVNPDGFCLTDEHAEYCDSVEAVDEGGDARCQKTAPAPKRAPCQAEAAADAEEDGAVLNLNGWCQAYYTQQDETVPTPREEPDDQASAAVREAAPPAADDRPRYGGAVPQQLLQVLEEHPAHAVYYGHAYDAANHVLPDLSGNDRTARLTAGSAVVETADGHGANRMVSFLSGTQTSALVWPSDSIPATFTICSVTRWTSEDPAKRERIINGLRGDSVFATVDGVNFLHGHHRPWQGHGGAGSAYYGDGWKTRLEGTRHNLDWVVLCGTNDNSVPAPGNVVYDGTEVGDTNGGQGGAALNINLLVDQRSDWALHSLFIWDRALTQHEMSTVTAALTEQLKGPVQPLYEGVVTSLPLLELLDEHPAYGAYFGSEFDASARRLPDLSGNARHAIAGAGVELQHAAGNGALQDVGFIQGRAEDNLQARPVPCILFKCSSCLLSATDAQHPPASVLVRVAGGTGAALNSFSLRGSGMAVP